MCQSTENFVRISFPGLLALFALRKMTHYSSATLYLAASPRCLGVAFGILSLDSSGDDLVYGRNAWLDSGYGDCDSTWLLDEFHTFSTLRQTRILKCCSPFCCRTEKRAQSMHSGSSFALRSSH